MPNYNITIDSKFNPYSFEDYLKPLSILQEQHNQAADAYATQLANSAGLLDALRVNSEDAEAAKDVEDYENKLKDLANDLASNGLNRTNRRGVYETKAQTGYIERLKKAMDNRNTFISQQNEIQIKDPTRRFSDYAYNHGITYFMNPDYHYGSYSLNDIKDNVAKAVTYLSKSGYVPEGENPTIQNIGYLTKMLSERKGVSIDEILKAIEAVQMGNSATQSQREIVSEMQNIVQDAVDASMGNQYTWTRQQRQEALDWGARGLYAALGDVNHKTFNVPEPKTVSSSGSGNNGYIPAQYIWEDVLNADANTPNLAGFDNRQIKMAHKLKQYANGETTEKPDYAFGIGNLAENLNTFLNVKKDSDGKLDEKTQLAALQMLKTADNGNLEFRIPKELIPENLLKEYEKRIVSYDSEAGAGGAKLFARANKYVFENIEKKFKKNDDNFKQLTNEYDDYLSKGALRGEVALLYGLDDLSTEHVIKNLRNLAGISEDQSGKQMAPLYQGSNAEGRLVNPLNAQRNYEDMTSALYDENKKWKSGNKIHFTIDADNNLIAIVSGGGKSFQLNVQKAIDKNKSVLAEKIAEYNKLNTEFKKIETEIGEDEDLMRIQYELINGNQNSISVADKKRWLDKFQEYNNAKQKAQNMGSELFSNIFDFTTLKQGITNITNTSSSGRNNS